MLLATLAVLAVACGAVDQQHDLTEKYAALNAAYKIGALRYRDYSAAVERLRIEHKNATHPPPPLKRVRVPEFTDPTLLKHVERLQSEYAKVLHIPSENRKALVKQLTSAGGVAILVGLEVDLRPGSDTEILFRQESNFIYTTGFDHPGAKVIIGLDPDNKALPAAAAWLFVPRGDPVWVGRTETLDDYRSKYDVDDVFWIEDYEKKLAELAPTTIYSLADAKLFALDPPPCAEAASHDQGTLRYALSEARVIKSEKELMMIKAATDIAVEEHKTIMRHIRCGDYESDAESLFRYVGHNYGARFQSYIPIVGSGPNSAALHYNDNEAVIPSGSLVLVDAAAELGQTRNGGGYTSDITRTWPCSGTFSHDQRALYDVVFAAQDACVKHAVVGGSMSKATQASHTEIIKGLLHIGILQDGTVDELLTLRMQSLFMPHGLGHAVGLDVHDPGNLTPFRAGMVITCEPGIYFYPSKLDPAYADPKLSKHLNKQLIESRFIHMGGIRIEDVVAITAKGPINYSGGLPRTSHDVEVFMHTGKVPLH